MLHDPTQVRLGRLPRRSDPRTLRLAEYLTPGALPPIPVAIDNGTKVKDWGMLANDQLGDCTCAGILHAIMLWKSSGAAPPNFSDSDAIVLYEQLCGYKPGDQSTDQGGVELDILKAWRKAPLADSALDAFIAVNPRNWNQVKAALYLFGTLYMGLSLPTSAQDEDVWRSTSGTPGSWGGHCVIASAYSDRARCLGDDTLTCITWGAEKKMTRQWLSAYCDELYALLSPDWVGPDGKAPNGFDLAQLQADLAKV